MTEWWKCPNGRCEHGSVLHDIGEPEEVPRCCVDGCRCGADDEDTDLIPDGPTRGAEPGTEPTDG